MKYLQTQVLTANRWVDQKSFDEPELPLAGDCAEACLASLFNIDRVDVPELYRRGVSAYQYWLSFRDFIESRGFSVSRKDSNYIPRGLYLQSGVSYYGTRHMVIMSEGEMVHDPHPSRAGLLSPETVWVLSPIDPGAFKLL